MKQIVISRPIELVAGSGLDLRATVATFGNPEINSEIALTTDAEDILGIMVTIIGLVVA